jgi:hypothetical protein
MPLSSSVGRPTLWSPAGHRAGMAESREGEREAEEGDDKWGPCVSEREGERAREQAARTGCDAGPRGRRRT